MQRPRRTSEFQDDPGCIRRPSRNQQRSTPGPSPQGGNGMVAACTTGTAKKYSIRQSRIAVPSRPSSNDRSFNPYLTVPSSSMRGVTPQKTPLPKNTANRVLFTAEKQRTGQGAGSNYVPLHNDKKWVQEQTQRITEHLLRQNTLGGGISTEFLNRGLRQMSIKHFVAIINYFLGYIWGSRFTVGSNHVDDIINILQKLQYPHPVNKSWLKTPNTQHSFGNVIVLFDFLMDFVPPSEEKYENEMYFDIKEPEKGLAVARIKDDIFQISNLEFQRELLRNSEKGFMLWDKQKNEEFSSLKKQTCDFLIQQKCGIANLEAMEMEIENSQEILKSLENERPSEDREMLKMKSKLSRDLKSLRHNIGTLQNEYEINEKDIKELGLHKMNAAKEVDTIERDIQALQAKLNNQSCTIEERDQMIADVMQHKQMLGIKERAIQDLQNRYHNDQILQSKAIKQLNDKIENFNVHMREVKFSDLKKIDNNASLSVEDLELSLRPQQTELDRVITQLEEINKIALDSIKGNKEETLQLREYCKQLTNVIDAELHPKLNALRTTNTNNVANLEKLVHALKKDECELLEIIQKTDEDLLMAEVTTNELQSFIENKKRLIEELVEANEQTMYHAEQKHKLCLEQRKAFLKIYDEMLEECIQSDELQLLTKQVQLQEKQIEEFRKEFKN